MLKLRYNGRRFPRAVILNNHKKKSFLTDRRVLEIDDDDAYQMLKDNVRLSVNPIVWEFSVEAVIAKKDEPWHKASKPLEPRSVEPTPEPEPEALEAPAEESPPEVKKPKTKKKKAISK